MFYFPRFCKLLCRYFVKNCLRKEIVDLNSLQTCSSLYCQQYLVFFKPFTLFKSIFKASQMSQKGTFFEKCYFVLYKEAQIWHYMLVKAFMFFLQNKTFIGFFTCSQRNRKQNKIFQKTLKGISRLPSFCPSFSSLK